MQQCFHEQILQDNSNSIRLHVFDLNFPHQVLFPFYPMASSVFLSDLITASGMPGGRTVGTDGESWNHSSVPQTINQEGARQ